MKNKGKIFEECIKGSIPDYCLLIRLPDPPHSFEKRIDTKFAVKNPCDFLCYDSIDNRLWCLELKSTSNKYMTFEDIYSDKQENKMIHRHQTKSLLRFSEYNGVVAGFIFNFRHFEGEANSIELSYFMEVNKFQKMCDNIGKKSFTEIDILNNGAIKIQGTKKRTRYSWDIDSLLKEYKI